MALAEHLVLADAELLAGGELALARVAREARQVVDLVARLAHPVRGRHRPAALEALGAEQLRVVGLAVELVLLEEAGGVRVEHAGAHAAAQAVRVPRPRRHLEDVPVRDHLAAERAVARLGLEQNRKEEKRAYSHV